jgi:predicted  nucleic acid-binding Zn-ribbon protein
MTNFLIENYQIIAGSIMSIFAYFGGKKIKIAEENKATSDALTSMQTTYDVFVNDLRERYNELKEEINNLKSSDIQNRNEIKELRQQNKSLVLELGLWEKKYDVLKSEFEDYKKENNH